MANGWRWWKQGLNRPKYQKGHRGFRTYESPKDCKSVPKLDESESGQMVQEKVKWTYREFCEQNSSSIFTFCCVCVVRAQAWHLPYFSTIWPEPEYLFLGHFDPLSKCSSPWVSYIIGCQGSYGPINNFIILRNVRISAMPQTDIQLDLRLWLKKSLFEAFCCCFCERIATSRDCNFSQCRHCSASLFRDVRSFCDLTVTLKKKSPLTVACNQEWVTCSGSKDLHKRTSIQCVAFSAVHLHWHQPTLLKFSCLHSSGADRLPYVHGHTRLTFSPLNLKSGATCILQNSTTPSPRAWHHFSKRRLLVTL